MGDILGSFPSGVRARMKYARKACGDLWGQSTIFETVLSNCLWPRMRLEHYRW